MQKKHVICAFAAVLIATPLYAVGASLTLAGEQAMVAAQQASPEFLRQDDTEAAERVVLIAAAGDTRPQARSRMQGTARTQSRTEIAWEPNRGEDAKSLEETRAQVLERTSPVRPDDRRVETGSSAAFGEEARARMTTPELR